MKYIVFISIFWILNLGCSSKLPAQAVTWYYPWENAIQNLEVAGNTEIIPLPLNGKVERILRITNNTSGGMQLSGYSTTSNDVSPKVYYLPEIHNFSNRTILDLMLPFQNRTVSIKPRNSAYFLVRYSGRRAGKFNVNLSFEGTNGKRVTASKMVYVGKNLSASNLSLNVWAYFSYPLLSGLQNQAVNDLVAHHANVLVIPPNVLPTITATTIASSTPKLDNFLKGLTGKFDYYLVYSNYKNYSDNLILSDKWKRNFYQWHKLIKNNLMKSGVDYSKVYFYPYDEPNAKQAQNLIKMINWSKEQNIDAKYYVTINGYGNINLAKYADIVQVINKPQNLAMYSELKGKKSQLWLYDIISESRNRSAQKFLKYGWEAFKYGASGIGTWNYADISKAYSSDAIQNFSSSKSKGAAKGSWDLQPKSYQRDYSLIYRQGDNLYSSLRWEALSQSIQEYKFLKLYEAKNGSQKANLLAGQLLSGRITAEKWNAIKLSLIN